MGFFLTGASFIISLFMVERIMQQLCPPCSIQQQCNTWKLSRTGILLYSGSTADFPCFFIPWGSIGHACRVDDGIIIAEHDDFNSFYLPAEHELAESTLTRILQKIPPRHSEEPFNEADGVFFMHEPERPGIRPFLKIGIPYLIVGLLLPVLLPEYPGVTKLSIACIVFAGAIVITGPYNFLDEFEVDTFIGNEQRRTRRGIHVKAPTGWRYFLPWSHISECLSVNNQIYFLKLRGSPKGICISSADRPIPISVSRQVKIRAGWKQLLIDSCLVFLLLVASLIWGEYWS